MSGNREYKSDVFSMLLEDKKNALQLYNAFREDVLKRFLIEHRSEVVKVTQLDYTFDRQIELERIDARREGKAEGKSEGKSEERKIMVKIKEGFTDDDLIKLGYAPEAIKSAKETLELLLT